MLHGPAQIRVHEDCALAELRKDDGKAGDEETAAFLRCGADDGERFAFEITVEPAQHQLAAQRAQWFDLGSEGIEGGEQRLADFRFASDEIRIIELTCEREI